MEADPVYIGKQLGLENSWHGRKTINDDIVEVEDDRSQLSETVRTVQ
jgi:hypothetical protein